MDYLKRYQRRVLADGDTRKDIEVTRGVRNFDYMLANKTSPTVHDVLLSLNDENSDEMIEKEVRCEISNVTNTDQDKYDEKYIKFSVSEPITYGSCVKWRNANWLILFEENMTFEIYQKFTMRRCNNIFNFKYKGVLYHIPQIVKNLTLYSDGLDDKVYTSTPDGKRQIIIPNNILTEKIKVGTRVMLTNSSVYVITHIDDFSSPGVRTMICRETTAHSLDDLENNIAYNEDSENTEIPNGVVEIEGEDSIYLCDFVTYKIKGLRNSNYIWKLSNDMAKIIYQDETTCDVECGENLNYINKTFDLELYENETKIITKKIKIRGMA